MNRVDKEIWLLWFGLFVVAAGYLMAHINDPISLGKFIFAGIGVYSSWKLSFGKVGGDS